MSMYATAQLLAADDRNLSLIRCSCVSFSRESYPFATEKVFCLQELVNLALLPSPIVSGEVIHSVAAPPDLRRDMSNPSMK